MSFHIRGRIRPRSRLGAVRTHPGIHWLALIVAIVAGLGLAHVHWLGLVAGGALVGLVATSLIRALLAALGFGMFALALWVGGLWWAGTLSRVLATGELAAIAVVIGLGAPLVGSLIRGVV